MTENLAEMPWISIVKEIFLRLFEELKDAPELPPSARDALTVARREFEAALADAEYGVNPAEPFIKAIPTTLPVFVPLIGEDEMRTKLSASLQRIFPPIIDEFAQREGFRSAMSEFTDHVLQPAIKNALETHADGISTWLAKLVKEGMDSWSGEDVVEDSFWTPLPDADTLAIQQGVSPVTDFDSLLGDFWPEDEDVEEFLASIRKGRGRNAA